MIRRHAVRNGSVEVAIYEYPGTGPAIVTHMDAIPAWIAALRAFA
jgi:hypothetical protein